jgi:amidohydrolase
MVASFQARADALFDWTVDLRRRLHRRPELAFEEHETAALVAETLRQIGLEPETGVARTGVLAEVVGGLPGPPRALRADLDALPIQEATGLDFASETPGVMHACGHDAHTAMLLAAVRILQESRDDLAGTVRFLFQPSEEKLPGGAPAMIEAGALAARDGHPAPERILGQHVFPELPSGVIGVRGGPFMASADEVYLTVRGEGGHAAAPHRLRADAVLAQAHVLTALQAVISRHCPPEIPSILSFGKVTASGATNVIPAEVRLEGTLRSMDEGWRFRAHDLIRRTAEGAAAALGATCEVEIAVGYPALVNDPGTASAVREAAVAYVGAERVVDLPMWFASEDFAYYTRELPGAFYVLGVGNEAAGVTHGLHTPRFTVDEEALRTGAGFMAYAAWRFGEAPSGNEGERE